VSNKLPDDQQVTDGEFLTTPHFPQLSDGTKLDELEQRCYATLDGFIRLLWSQPLDEQSRHELFQCVLELVFSFSAFTKLIVADISAAFEGLRSGFVWTNAELMWCVDQCKQHMAEKRDLRKLIGVYKSENDQSEELERIKAQLEVFSTKINNQLKGPRLRRERVQKRHEEMDKAMELGYTGERLYTFMKDNHRVLMLNGKCYISREQMERAYREAKRSKVAASGTAIPPTDTTQPETSTEPPTG
jgi:hypothetical protein